LKTLDSGFRRNDVQGFHITARELKLTALAQTQTDYLWTWRFALQETLAASQGQGLTRRIRFIYFKKR
jgi:hypothetical protein